MIKLISQLLHPVHFAYRMNTSFMIAGALCISISTLIYVFIAKMNNSGNDRSATDDFIDKVI